MTPSTLRRDLSRRRPGLSSEVQPFVSNLIQQLKAIEDGTGNPETLPGLMEYQLKRIEAASRTA